MRFVSSLKLTKKHCGIAHVFQRQSDLIETSREKTEGLREIVYEACAIDPAGDYVPFIKPGDADERLWGQKLFRRS